MSDYRLAPASDRSQEPSAFGAIFAGLLGALAVGSIVKGLLDRRRSGSVSAAGPDGAETSEGASSPQ